MALAPDRFEIAERKRKWAMEQQRREQEKKVLMGKYGDKLGAALSEYRYLALKEEKKRNDLRQVLAIELGQLFTLGGNAELAMMALMELFSLIDASLYELKEEVDHMGWTGPY